MCGGGRRPAAAKREEPFDLVLLDIGYAGRLLKSVGGCWAGARNRASRLLSCRATATPTKLAESLPHGADDYIAKPYGVAQMVAKVEHALA